MKELVHAVVVFGLSLATAGGTAADGMFLTGNDVHDGCRRGDGVVGFYVMGLSDGYGTAVELHETKRMYCLPAQARGRQVMDVACRYFEQNPDGRHLVAAPQIVAALALAFPCLE